MVSTLKVDTIQNVSTGTTAMTIGTNGVISEPNRPCFHVGKTGDQTVNDATVATVTFESVTDGGDSGRTINKGGLFASNKFTVTSTTTGIYYFYTNLFGYSAGDATDTYVFFRKNGSTMMMSSYYQRYGGSYNFTFQLNGLINLDTAGDYVEVVVDVDQAGGNSVLINYEGGYGRTEFGGYKIA